MSSGANAYFVEWSTVLILLNGVSFREFSRRHVQIPGRYSRSLVSKSSPRIKNYNRTKNIGLFPGIQILAHVLKIISFVDML